MVTVYRNGVWIAAIPALPGRREINKAIALLPANCRSLCFDDDERDHDNDTLYYAEPESPNVWCLIFHQENTQNTQNTQNESEEIEPFEQI